MAIDEFKVENIEEIEENKSDSNYHVVYVKHMGTDINGEYIYHFYLSDNPDEVFAEGWGESPACNVKDRLMDIDEDQYQYVVELKSEIKLDLARECCCFTMQDCRDHIIALAYENLDGAEEYPEPRIIIQFGDIIEDVEKMFVQRDVVLRYV